MSQGDSEAVRAKPEQMAALNGKYWRPVLMSLLGVDRAAEADSTAGVVIFAFLKPTLLYVP